MKRSTFLKRAALLVGGTALAGRVPTASDAAPALELPAAASEPMLETLVATGGLCAPLPLYYPIEKLWTRPLLDALPSFTAERGIS